MSELGEENNAEDATVRGRVVVCLLRSFDFEDRRDEVALLVNGVECLVFLGLFLREYRVSSASSAYREWFVFGLVFVIFSHN